MPDVEPLVDVARPRPLKPPTAAEISPTGMTADEIREITKRKSDLDPTRPTDE